MEDEVWVSIPGYPNYKISNYGRVFNVRHDRFLRPCSDSYGYSQVTLYGPAGRSTILVHHLVAEAFLPERPSGYQINHDDGDKTCNRIDNLAWVTPGENIRHAVRTGLKPPSGSKGIRIIETGQVFDSVSSCARMLRGSQGAISECLSGRRYRHKGFTFEYVDKEDFV